MKEDAIQLHYPDQYIEKEKLEPLVLKGGQLNDIIIDTGLATKMHE